MTMVDGDIEYKRPPDILIHGHITTLQSLNVT